MMFDSWYAYDPDINPRANAGKDGEEDVIPSSTDPITGNMLVRDVILAHPDAAEILMRIGMGCISCPASLMESLEEACMVHGMDGEEVVKYLNQELELTDPAET